MKRLEDGIIISNDIYLIITGCNALKFKYIDKAIIVPSKEFIDNLREEFKEICEKAYQTKVTFISEEDMTNSMNELIDKYKGRYPIVSMDEIYINPFDLLRLEGFIGIIFAFPFFYLYLYVSCKVKKEEKNDINYFNYCNYSFSNIMEYFKFIFDFKNKYNKIKENKN